MIKKISLLSLVALLCVASVSAEPKKLNKAETSKAKAAKAKKQTRQTEEVTPLEDVTGEVIVDKDGVTRFCGPKDCGSPKWNKNGCDKLVACVEKLLCAKFQCLERNIDRDFCELREILCNKFKADFICLEERIGLKLRDIEARLADFIVCRLDRTESNIEEYICHKIKCLTELICLKFAENSCDIDQLACQVANVAHTLDCVEVALAGLIGVLNTTADTAYVGQLTTILATLNACATALEECSFSCSDIAAGVCI